MQKEIEIKIQLKDKENIVKKLKELGGEKGKSYTQTTYGFFSNNSIEKGIFPRIRQENGSLIKIKNNVYLTKEGLPMTLLLKQEFLNLCQKFALIIEGKIIEYKRNVTTGTRSVMRGVLKRV
jgi:adenylate cyclase class IV